MANLFFSFEQRKKRRTLPLKKRLCRVESLESRELLAVTAGFEAAESVSAAAAVCSPEPKTAGYLLSTPVITTENASYGTNAHRISWTSVGNAESYQIDYSSDGQHWKSLITSQTSVVIKNLMYGDKVQYRVCALGEDSTINSAWSAVKSFYVCPYDIDGDGFVGPGDRSIMSSAWFSAEGDDNWNPACDIDGDLFIGPGDLSFLSSSWFKTTDELVITSLKLTFDGSQLSIVNADSSETETALFAGDVVYYKIGAKGEYLEAGTVSSESNFFKVAAFRDPGNYDVWVKVHREGIAEDWEGSISFSIDDPTRKFSSLFFAFDEYTVSVEGWTDTSLLKGDEVYYKLEKNDSYINAGTVQSDRSSFAVKTFNGPGNYSLWVKIVRQGVSEPWEKSISFSLEESNVKAEDISASLSWNTTSGGLDLTWKAINNFGKNAELSVYFASGTTYNTIVSGSVDKQTIASGTKAGSSGTLHIDGNKLITDINSTTFKYIIVCIGNEVVASIADVVLSINSGVNTDLVLQKNLDAIKSGLRASGISKAVVTSGWRRPEDQARAMYGNLARSDMKSAIAYQYSLYASAGDKVIAVFEEQAIKYNYDLATVQAHASEIKQLMTNKVNELTNQGIRVSMHCVTQDSYKAHNILDIGRGPFNSTNIPLFRAAMSGKTSKILDEPANGCLHLEF